MDIYDESIFEDLNMGPLEMTELNFESLEMCQEITDFTHPISDLNLNQDMFDLMESSMGSSFAPMSFESLEAFDILFPFTQEEEQIPNGISQLKQLLLTKPNTEANPTLVPSTDSGMGNNSQKSETKQCDRIKRTHNSKSSQNIMTLLLKPERTNDSSIKDAKTNVPRKQEVERKSAAKTLKFPPCFICGGKASGLHYGVNSCEACKGFFRRYLIRNEEYKCPKSGDCEIVNRNRENCSGCRLQKCFSLGMSKNKSKLGRYTLSRRTETIQQVNKLEGKVAGESVKRKITNDAIDTKKANKKASPSKLIIHSKEVFSKAKTPEGIAAVLAKAMGEIKPYGPKITDDEKVNSAIKFHYERYKTKVDMYGEMKSVPMAEYYKLLKEYGIDIDGRLKVLKDYVREIERITVRYCNFAKCIPGFTSLSRKDQSNLLKASRCDFFLILMSDGYNDDYKVILTRRGVAYHVEEVADKCFSRKLIMNICETYRRWQTLCLTKAEKALLIAVTIFFTDRCILDNYKSVETIQLMLVGRLRKQLEETCQATAKKRFYKIIDYLTLMRDSTELYLNEYKQLCNEEIVIEEVPKMAEFLVEDW